MATKDQAQGECWRFTGPDGDGCLWLEWDCDDRVQRRLNLGAIGSMLGRLGESLGDRPDLLRTIASLYDREINCGLQTFWDGGVRVWIGGELDDEKKASEIFSIHRLGDIPAWLEREAGKA